MKARTEWIPGTDEFQVYIWQRSLDGSRAYYTLGEHGWVLVQVAEGGVIEPAFKAPGTLAKALAEAFTEMAPPDRAQAEHLKDAITVRDRILDAYLPRPE